MAMEYEYFGDTLTCSECGKEYREQIRWLPGGQVSPVVHECRTLRRRILTPEQARIRELEQELAQARDILQDCRLWFEYTGLHLEEGNLDEAELYRKIRAALHPEEQR